MILNTIKDLREAIKDLNDNDQICIETVDCDNGDTLDLYPISIDIYTNITMLDGSVIKEIRFVQNNNKI